MNAFANKSDIQYTLTCSTDGDNECREVDTSTQMPNTTNNQEIVKSIDISPGEIHTYRLDLNFIYKNENQNDNQGRSITANVQILEATNPTITMDIQNGTLDKNSAIVEYNGSETFTVTPEAGYLLSNMEVSCTNGITNTVVDNQITINDVRLSTTCNVTFTPSYDIHGYAVNQNDEPLAGVRVEAHSSVRSAVTDVTGYFELTNVVVGEHELILKQGETTIHNSNFTINKGEDFEIAGNTIISTNPTEPIKIKVIIENEQSKSIIRDTTYRVEVEATKATISSPLNIIESGTNATVTVTPNVGYDYSNVMCTNGQTGVWTNNTLTVNNVSDDTTCTLGFGAQTYQLSMDTKTSEGMIYKSVIYDENYGELPELEREHYVFNGWFTLPNGGSEVTSTTKVETASNHTIHAQWSPVGYTVVYDCEENGGECTIPNPTVSYGSEVDLTNIATKSGYTFVGWNTDKDATTGISSLTMDGAGKTLYAIYKKVITVTYNPNGSVLSKQTDSCEIYNNATDCSFTSPKITRENYRIVGFNEDQNASESGLNAETQYTTTSNKTYYAITLETTPPAITLSSESNTTYAKNRSVTVTLSDTSGIASGASIKYGWSLSNTTAPSTYTNATLSYTVGATSTTFTASSTNTLTGQYYLWVVPVTYKDIYNNIQSTNKISTGKFYFDNTGPQITSFSATSGRESLVQISAVENISNIDKYYFGYVDYSAGVTCDSATYIASASTNYTFSSLVEGNKLICGYATDALGNKSSYSSNKIEIYQTIDYTWATKAGITKTNVKAIMAQTTLSSPATYTYNGTTYNKRRTVDVSEGTTNKIHLSVYSSNGTIEDLLLFSSNSIMYLPADSSYFFSDSYFTGSAYPNTFTYLEYVQAENLDVSKVTSMNRMFSFAGYSASTFNVNFSNWNTSQVKDMGFMFSRAAYSTATLNLNLSAWNTSQVTTMYAMFGYCGYNATTWNIGNLDNWNTSQVTDMSFMFSRSGHNAKTLNVGNLKKWNTSKTSNMYSMFLYFGSNVTTFNMDLSNWNTSKVTDMRFMFSDVCENSSTCTINIKGFNLSSSNTTLTNYGYIFYQMNSNARVIVGSAASQSWILNLNPSAYYRPSSWSTANVVVN